MGLFHDMLHDPDDSLLIGDCLSDAEAMRREFYVTQESQPTGEAGRQTNRLTNQGRRRKVTA